MNQAIKKVTVLITVLLLTIVVFTNISASATVHISDDLNDQLDSKIDIDEEIITLMEEVKIPSISACIIKNDSIIWYGSYGFYNRLLRLKPTKDTVYMAGSVSKAFATTALMQLYEKGLFDLDDDINDYLPYPLRNPHHPEVPITFKMVLSHQSSLPLTFPSQYPSLYTAYLLNFPKLTYPDFKEFLVPGGKVYDPNVWTKNRPGDAFNYSNVGFMLVEYLFELISGQDFQEYCKENIFIPLKMYNTSYNILNFKRFDRAVPYAQIGNFNFRLPFYILPSPGAGGIVTTIEDLSHFLIAHMNNGTYDGVQILKNSSIELMHTLHYYHELTEHYQFQYGLGWMFFNKSGVIYQGHGGDTFGYKARMLYRGIDMTGVILLINKNIVFGRSAEDAFKFHETLGQIIDLLFLKSEEL